MKHSPSLLLFLSLSSLLLLSSLSKATTITNYKHFDDFAGGDTDLPLDQPPPLPPPVPDTAESPPSDDGGDGSDDGDTTQLLPPPPPSEQTEYTPPFSAPSGIDLLPPPSPSPFGVLPPTIGGSGSGNALSFGQPISNGFGQQQQQHPLSGFGQQQQQQQQLQGLNGGSQLPLVDNTPYDSGCERIREGVVEYYYLVMMLCSFVVFF